jgi:hypothetical protein
MRYLALILTSIAGALVIDRARGLSRTEKPKIALSMSTKVAEHESGGIPAGTSGQRPTEDTLRLELQQSIETYRVMHTLMVQAAAALLAATAGLITASLLTASVVPIVFSIGLSWLTVGVLGRLSHYAGAAAFSAVQIEEQLGVPQGFLATYIDVTRRPTVTTDFKLASAVRNNTKAFKKAVKRAYAPEWFGGFRLIILVGGVAQVLLATGIVGHTRGFW